MAFKTLARPEAGQGQHCQRARRSRTEHAQGSRSLPRHEALLKPTRDDTAKMSHAAQPHRTNAVMMATIDPDRRPRPRSVSRGPLKARAAPMMSSGSKTKAY